MDPRPIPQRDRVVPTGSLYQFEEPEKKEKEKKNGNHDN
jgi:hypothetical protein